MKNEAEPGQHIDGRQDFRSVNTDARVRVGRTRQVSTGQRTRRRHTLSLLAKEGT